MGTDAAAVTGFVALFVLMLLRVPVGMAMGLVGVSGFAYLVGGGPALKVVGHTSMRTVTDYTFGVIIVMTVELGLIHPPVGMNVFVIKSVVQDVSFATIFRGVIPFICTDIIRLTILIAFPVLALWLPARM